MGNYLICSLFLVPLGEEFSHKNGILADFVGKILRKMISKGLFDAVAELVEAQGPRMQD